MIQRIGCSLPTAIGDRSRSVGESTRIRLIHRPIIPGIAPPMRPIIFWNLPIFFIICCI